MQAGMISQEEAKASLAQINAGKEQIKTARSKINAGKNRSAGQRQRLQRLKQSWIKKQRAKESKANDQNK